MSDGWPTTGAQARRRIAAGDGAIGAFVEVLDEIPPGDVDGPLAGVPVAVKELFDVAGASSSYGSLALEGRRATTDATVVRRLREAGADVVGLTRSHELGWGITTQHEQRGSTRNPRALDRIPGGSSGGSAAAVAAGLVPLAIGTDTGGSIRLPAAFCGVLGLKTTLGRISRRGCVPLAPSFDTPGLLASSVDLLARGLVALAGEDDGDPATHDTPATPAALSALALPPGDAGFVFAVPEGLQPSPLTGARAAALEQAVWALVAAGGRPVDVSPPPAAGMEDILVPILMAEALDVHARQLGTWPAHAEQLGRDLRARLRAAESVTVDAYLAARAAADEVRVGFRTAFRTADVLVSVVGAAGPSTVADPDRVLVDGTPKSLLAATMPSTLPQNVAGLPSLTVPIGIDDDGLPIGVQLTAAPWRETDLLDLGRRLEALGAIEVRAVS